MMTISEFVQQLKILFPGVKFFNGAIDRKNKQCVGVYARGNTTPNIAIGGVQNSSYGILPVSLLVHWTEDSNLCEIQSNTIYEQLAFVQNLIVGGRRVISLSMIDSGPVNVARDADNTAEMVIRLNIIHER